MSEAIPGAWMQRRAEIVPLLELLSEVRPERVCEIGTAEGGTTVALARCAPSVKLMIGVDLYIRRKHLLRATAGQSRASMVLIDGDSHSDAVVGRVDRALGDALLDVLFIDGDHSLAGVRDDFLTYRRFVRDGGLVVFHDIVPDSLHRHGTRTVMASGDVPRFWDVIKGAYIHQEFVEDEGQDGFGIGVLHYSPDVDVDRALSPISREDGVAETGRDRS